MTHCLHSIIKFKCYSDLQLNAEVQAMIKGIYKGEERVTFYDMALMNMLY